MPQQNAILKAFNGGEFSELLGGRIDHNRFPSSMRRMRNWIAMAQGPMTRRSGTKFIAPQYDETKQCRLVPFTYADDQFYMIEFAPGRCRFHTENGMLAYAAQAITAVGAAGVPLVLAVATPAAVGAQVVLSGFPVATKLNGIATVTANTAWTMTLNVQLPAGVWSFGPLYSSTIYHIANPYTEAQAKALRSLQSLNTTYLFTGSKPKKLLRNSEYDWTIVDIDFVDGPYMVVNDSDTRFSFSATGNAANLPSGVASASSEVAGYEAWKAFDDDANGTYWASGANQTGILAYQFAVPTVVNGYCIYIPRQNESTSYATQDYAPGTWTFEGSTDGATWTVLDSKIGYVSYSARRSLFFEVNNSVAFTYYRINIKECRTNGSVNPRISRLVMRSPSTAAVTITASATKNINGNRGFLATDVGRLLRVQGNDSFWRCFKIASVVSTTQITATVVTEPLDAAASFSEWRLGWFSDTTGYPTCGAFYLDRLYLGGVTDAPDTVMASAVGAYENHAPSVADGTVEDDNGVVITLNSRRTARICWISSDDKSLVVGTGSSEFVITGTANDPTVTARNVKARPTSRRGSANIEPVRVDRQLLYCQKARRSLREMAYVYDVDGYKSPSMQLLAPHIGVSPFLRMEYTAEPHSIVWVLRENGTLAGFTYNRDEECVGWHVHDTDGLYEDIAEGVTPDGSQDVLWRAVKRTINGVTRRYIEVSAKAFGEGDLLQDAFFVDCGVKYVGAPVTVLNGLQHLEGKDVVILADGGVVNGLTVVNGSVTLPYAASTVIVGLGYESIAETQRLEAGAAQGTAQGKTKRIHSVVARLYKTLGIDVGRVNPENGEDVFERLHLRDTSEAVNQVTPLFTGDVSLDMPLGYDYDGTIVIRAPAASPLPATVVALMPNVVTQG